MILRQNFKWIAHRGASGHEPENTLLAIEKALQMEMKWIEIDIQYADGELFVFHDKTLDRTTDGKGRLKEMKKNYLRSLNAGKGTRIPYLKEVLDKMENRGNLIIEIKDDEAVLPLVQLLRRYLNSSRFSPDNFIVSSFNSDHIQIFRSLEERIPVAIISDTCSDEKISIAKKYNCGSIHINADTLNQEFVDKSHKNNLDVYVFTVDTDDLLKKVIQLNADGIFTDFPELRNSFEE